MTLTFPPGGFTQLLRQMRRGLPASHAILVVEGSTDRRAFMHILAPTVRVMPANGKSILLAAYDELGRGQHPSLFFIMDCDNNSEPSRKGQIDLAITSHRDLEADMLFSLNAYERMAIELLADQHLDLSSLEVAADRVLTAAVRLAEDFSRVRDAARSLGLRIRFRDPITGRREVPRPEHFAGTFEPVSRPPGLDQVTRAISSLTGWSPAEERAVAAVAANAEPCSHNAAMCSECSLARFCNGHDAVHALALALTDELGMRIHATDVERHLRLSLDRSRLADWRVAQRVRAWEATSGTTLLRPTT